MKNQTPVIPCPQILMDVIWEVRYGTPMLELTPDSAKAAGAIPPAENDYAICFLQVKTEHLNAVINALESEGRLVEVITPTINAGFTKLENERVEAARREYEQRQEREHAAYKDFGAEISNIFLRTVNAAQFLAD